MWGRQRRGGTTVVRALATSEAPLVFPEHFPFVSRGFGTVESDATSSLLGPCPPALGRGGRVDTRSWRWGAVVLASLYGGRLRMRTWLLNAAHGQIAALASLAGGSAARKVTCCERRFCRSRSANSSTIAVRAKVWRSGVGGSIESFVQGKMAAMGRRGCI